MEESANEIKLVYKVYSIYRSLHASHLEYSGWDLVGMTKERNMSANNIKPLIKESYLTVIKNSLGSKNFKNFYARVNGKKTDVLVNGKYACAFYVSAVLVWFGLIKEGHCTVTSTLKDMQTAGWRKIKKPKAGCVIYWSLFDMGDGDPHKHLGFYIGNGWAVGTNPETGQPTKTKYNYRPIESLYWHNKLGK